MSKSAVRRLLLVEDNAGDARLLREMFDERGPASHITTMTHVVSLLEAEKCLSEGEVDVVLLDLGLPDANGITAVRRAQAAAPRVPVVVLTGLDDEALATQALNEGAQDYLIKGQIEASALFRSLRYAIERKLMEETLFAEKERAQVTLRSIGEGVICADILGNVTFLNLVAEQATGWSLQEAAGRPMVALGAGHLEQILDNLIDNAIDALTEPDAGPGGGSIRISATATDTGTLLTVSDDGPGMTAQERSRAFLRYTTGSQNGTGLGLAIVHRLVTANGGAIRLADTPGGGLTVEIELPSPADP